MSTQTNLVRSTRATAEGWFRALTSGDVEGALSYLAPDVEFINYTPVPGFNDDMAWIGTHRGPAAVRESILVFVGLCEVLNEELVALVVEGEEAMGVLHEVSRVKATGLEFEIEFIQRLTVRDGLIVRWKSYTDPSSILRALRGGSR
jgi:ketosteroid isomerase-like protein